jgi:hypothetical protein
MTQKRVAIPIKVNWTKNTFYFAIFLTFVWYTTHILGDPILYTRHSLHDRILPIFSWDCPFKCACGALFELLASFKGIVSCYFECAVSFLCNSIELTFMWPLTEHVCLLVKFRFRMEFFDFRVSAKLLYPVSWSLL